MQNMLAHHGKMQEKVHAHLQTLTLPLTAQPSDSFFTIRFNALFTIVADVLCLYSKAVAGSTVSLYD